MESLKEPSPASPTPSSIQSTEQLQSKMIALKKEQNQFITKLADLEQERSEHKLVLEALAEAPPERRCYRMMGGVLVERSVEEVKPALQRHKDLVEVMIEKMDKELEKVSKEYAYYSSRIEDSTKKEDNRATTQEV